MYNLLVAFGKIVKIPDVVIGTDELLVETDTQIIHNRKP